MLSAVTIETACGNMLHAQMHSIDVHLPCTLSPKSARLPRQQVTVEAWMRTHSHRHPARRAPACRSAAAMMAVPRAAPSAA